MAVGSHSCFRLFEEFFGVSTSHGRTLIFLQHFQVEPSQSKTLT
jgi:hypothetical protein